MKKRCYECKEIKLIDEFTIDKSKKDNLSVYCKICKRSRQNKWEKENSESVKGKHYLSRFGITREDYNAMFDKQNGCCGICNRHQSEFWKRLAIDHNHKTGKIRGLLCDQCNKGLGCFLDNKYLVFEAFKFLDEND